MTEHVHLWTYFGGCASCECGAELFPDGRIVLKSERARKHQARLRQLKERKARNG